MPHTSLHASCGWRFWSGCGAYCWLLVAAGWAGAQPPEHPTAAHPTAATNTSAAANPLRFEFTEVHMGTPFRVIFYAQGADTANRAAAAAFARIRLLDLRLSDYRNDSELMQLCRNPATGQAQAVSDDLWRVLVASQALAQRTEGAFDVTVGPLVRLWRRARRQHALPDPESLAAARRAVGFRHLQLDPSTQTVRLLVEGMRLDLGGIAVGYALDESLRELQRFGIKRALWDASGDVLAAEPPPGESGWKVGVAPLAADAPPSRFLSIAHCAVTTSGDFFQHIEIDGQRYSHIVDPHTGLGLSVPSSVTVIAPLAIDADSLATAASVLPVQRALKLIADTPGAEVLIVRQGAAALETVASPGWQQWELPPSGTP